MQAFETCCVALAGYNKLDSAAVVFIGHPAGSIRDCGRMASFTGTRFPLVKLGEHRLDS
jgi:hypothetical protein